MLKRLADPRLYLAAFAKVVAKERERQSDEAALAGGPPLTSLSHDVEALARRLSKLVPSFRYQLSPVVPRRALIEGKARILYHSPPLDKVVMTALATALGEVLAPTSSERLFSYRTGRSSKQALLQLSAFLRDHRAARPDPRARGLYVLRRDVKSYGDAMPSDPSSRLWVMLKAALESQNVSLDDPGWRWLMRAIRPPQAAGEGVGLAADTGIPTGSPLQPLMGNLYLSELDRSCERVHGAFYARYGDDIMFVHESLEVVQAAAHGMDHTILDLGLTWSTEKCMDLYLNAAGRPGTSTRYRGTTAMGYLGVRVDARGELGLSTEKVTRLLRSLARRLDDAKRICGNDSVESRADTYCAVINAALDPEHPVAERAAQLLRHVVSDRSQLKDLDYQIALRAAECITRMRGVRAFRAFPMHRLKQRHGLRSLVVARNRLEHAKRSRCRRSR